MDRVKNIEKEAFYGCKSLKSLTIPNSVTTLGDNISKNCISLKTIVFGDGVTSIRNQYFHKKLEHLVLGSGIKNLKYKAFADCTSLTSVTISNSMDYIEECAFLNCSSLVSIVFKGTQSEWDRIYKAYNWDEETGNYTIYCIDVSIPK